MKNPDIKGIMLLRFAFAFAVLFFLFFLVSGNLLWVEAWLFLAVILSYALIQFVWLSRNNLELLKKRFFPKTAKKSWDRKFVSILNILVFLLLILSSFDKRFSISSVPIPIKILAFLALSSGLCLMFLAMRESPFLSKIVEIQQNHKVISTGPYSIIRHPMYLGAIFLFLAIPIALGSFLAIIPSFLIAVSIIIRTSLEDKFLQKKLKGYKAYSQKVRYKLLPGVW